MISDFVTVSDISDSQKWFFIRQHRCRLLALCDWTQAADAPLTAEQKVAWADYRQLLRDIPQTYETPESVIFPEQPNG